MSDARATFRPRRGASRLAALVLAGALAAPAPAGAAPERRGDEGLEATFARLRVRLPRSRVERPRDLVIVQGRDLAFSGASPEIGRLRAMAFRLGEEWVAVPFQIDERDADGEWLWPGAPAGEGGVLTAEDQLVLRPRDLGVRVARTAWPEDAADGVEIEVQDPRTGGRGWAYLFRFDAPPPPGPPSDDVRAYSAALGDSFVTPYYRVFYPRRRGRFAPGVMTELAIDGRGRERHGPNLLDREKLRYKGRDRFLPGVGFERNEDRIEARPIEIIDGPLRAVRRIERRIRFTAWFDGKVASTAVFLPDRIILEEPDGLPWAMRFLVRRLSARFYWDFAPPPGSVLFADPVPLGVRADGKLTPVEASLAGLPSVWWALATPDHGALLAVYRHTGGAGQAAVGPALVYRDGATPDPPESAPGGQPAVGWRVPKTAKAQAGHKPGRVHLFVLDGFQPGAQNIVLERLRAPLRVKAGPGLAR